MKKFLLTVLFGAVAFGAMAQSGYPFSPVPFTSVKVHDNFWSQRLEASRNVTIPLAFSKCESEGRYKNFEAATLCMLTGDTTHVKGLSFDDTDVYKTIEGASYILQTYPDKKLERYIDSILVIVAAAQEEDGYLYTMRTMNPTHPHAWAGDKRWVNDEELSHELYNLGHMVEGAIAHYTATGKRNFLDIAIKYADCVCREIGDGEGQVRVVPGHQIAEMALAKLYVCTGDKKYLDMAKYFLDNRGDQSRTDEYSKLGTLKLQQRWEKDFGFMTMPDDIWLCVNEDGSWNEEMVEEQKELVVAKRKEFLDSHPEIVEMFMERGLDPYNMDGPMGGPFGGPQGGPGEGGPEGRPEGAQEGQQDAPGEGGQEGERHDGGPDGGPGGPGGRGMGGQMISDEYIMGEMEYAQAHLPILEQTEAVGHAVRAGYMYTGIADVAALTGDNEYIDAIDAIWDNVVSKKLYITGGIGSTGNGEAFGDNYELPNMSAYCETCAAIANVYWNYRLFLLHGESKYIDVLERTLYNGLLSGISLDGGGFFYPNPLESAGQHHRRPWFGCACCPSNICRFIPSLPGYIYAVHDNDIYVNLFVGGDADIQVGGQKVRLTQTTDYPWNGDVAITVKKSATFGMKVRIPGWALNEVVPSDLYEYADDVYPSYSVTVNGEEVSTELDCGYVTINRKWKKGDKVELHLDMEPRLVHANKHVEEDRGRVAVECGPIVYCAEWADNPDLKVRNILMDEEPDLTVEYKDNYINDKYGVNVITANVKSYAYAKDGTLQIHDAVLKMIPYYAWAHRGSGDMIVWIPQDPSAVTPLPAPTIASLSTITGSLLNGSEIFINDGLYPKERHRGGNVLYFTWEDGSEDDEEGDEDEDEVLGGTTEWIAYEFEEEEEVHACTLYWHDGSPWYNFRAPESWSLYYLTDSGEWAPVVALTDYPSEARVACRVEFEPVKTTGLKLVVVQQEGNYAGIYEWSVE